MKSRLLCIVMTFLLTVPALASDGYPLPDNLPRITPENIANLRSLASIGGPTQGKLVWSPDGQTLAVSTSEGVGLYQAPDYQNPHWIQGTGDPSFNDAGELEYDGQRWDAITGEMLGPVETPAPSRIFSPSGQIEVTYTSQGDETFVRHADGHTTRLDIGTGLSVDRAVFSPDEQYVAFALTSIRNQSLMLTVQLWNIETGGLTANLPQQLEILDTLTFHANGRLLIIGTATSAMYSPIFQDVIIVDSRTGDKLGPNTLRGLPVRFSPDGQLMAFATTEGIELWTNHELGVLEGVSAPLVFSPDGRTLAAASGDKVFLWNVSDVRLLPDTPRRILCAASMLYDLAYNTDGSLIASEDFKGHIEVWSVQTGVRRFELEGSGAVFPLKFSLDGKLLRTDVYGGDSKI